MCGAPALGREREILKILRKNFPNEILRVVTGCYRAPCIEPASRLRAGCRSSFLKKAVKLDASKGARRKGIFSWMISLAISTDGRNREL
jgi:hypothetical protein